MSAPGRPPGFYDDPDDASGSARYWDGATWTTRGSLPPPQAPQYAQEGLSDLAPAGPGAAAGRPAAVRVAFWFGNRRSGVWGEIGQTVFAAMFLLLALWQFGVGSAFGSVDNATETTGVVSAVQPVGRNSNGSPICRIEYAFQVEGVSYTGGTRDFTKGYCRSDEGDPFPVTYDSNDPGSNSSAKGSGSLFPLLGMILPAFFLLRGSWAIVIRRTRIGDGVPLIARSRAKFHGRQQARSGPAVPGATGD